MPLTKQALPLEPTPASVTAARKWVSTVCLELGRDDLVECAELGVSELVTNAILHGEAPIRLSVRGTRDHPRIEVHDASRRPPVLPQDPFRDDADIDLDNLDEIDAYLATNGRGLAMVAMSATAWGAAIESNGKVVWFEPDVTVKDHYVDPVMVGVEDPDSEWERLPDSVTVRLVDVDVQLFQSMLTQYGSLRRELRLLALVHDGDYPLAAELTHMFNAFERQFPPSALPTLDLWLRDAGPVTDLVFEASARSTHVFTQMLQMFEMADDFCESQRLLSLERTHEQITLQRWMLEEFLRQTDGEAPIPWPLVVESYQESSAS